MGLLRGRNVLIIIPKSQFSEDELFGLRSSLKENGANVVVLSRSGQEAFGEKKETFKPDGMIVDWNKQPGVFGKYHAVILIGGKGAKKFLWNDPIIPQILTDHYRAGSIIGAMGSALVVLNRASLITGEIPLPQEDEARKELESLNAICVDTPVTSLGNMVLGQGGNSVSEFSNIILDLFKERENAEKIQ